MRSGRRMEIGMGCATSESQIVARRRGIAVFAIEGGFDVDVLLVEFGGEMAVRGGRGSASIPGPKCSDRSNDRSNNRSNNRSNKGG